MNFDAKIFNDYDVRGIYPTEINGEVARTVAHALVRKFNPKTVCVCRDMRLSSREIRDGLIEVFLELGVDVYDAGLCGTEMQYFIAGSRDYDLVLQISASHNPPEYNGLKVVMKGPVAVTSDSGLYEVRDLMAMGKLPAASKPGKLTEIDVTDEWRDKVLSLVNAKDFKPLKVVVDAGNGMAGKLVPKVFEKLPFNLTMLYANLDGSFPNHIPNPLVEANNKILMETVMGTKADAGMTFDGDADRMFLIDDKGRFVPGTITTAILAKYFLKTHPGELILYNAICGRVVPETIEKFGGKSMRVRVGHSYIKRQMRETGAIFCGEHSGHYFYRDFYGAESGVLSGLLVLSLVSIERRKLSEMVNEFDKYPASGEINFFLADIPAMVAAIKNGFTHAKSIDELDGISVWYPDYWFNVRASKTEPLLRLNVEADNKELLEQKTRELVSKIEALGGKRK